MTLLNFIITRWHLLGQQLESYNQSKYFRAGLNYLAILDGIYTKQNTRSITNEKSKKKPTY